VPWPTPEFSAFDLLIAFNCVRPCMHTAHHSAREALIKKCALLAGENVSAMLVPPRVLVLCGVRDLESLPVDDDDVAAATGRPPRLPARGSARGTPLWWRRSPR
jgi:hypothetical protein